MWPVWLMWCSCGVHVVEIDNIIQPVAKIWNRLKLFDEQFSNRCAALFKTLPLVSIVG